LFTLCHMRLNDRSLFRSERSFFSQYVRVDGFDLANIVQERSGLDTFRNEAG